MPTPIPIGWELLTIGPDEVTGAYEVYALLGTKLEDGLRAMLGLWCRVKADVSVLQFIIFTAIESPTKDGYQTITYRFDDDEPVTEDWKAAYYGSDSSLFTGLFPLTDAENLIERLRTAERFGIRFEGTRQASHTVVFDKLDGLEEVYQPVAEACKETTQ